MSTKTGFMEAGLKYWTISAARENSQGFNRGNISVGVVAKDIKEALNLFSDSFPGHKAVNISHIGPVDAFGSEDEA